MLSGAVDYFGFLGLPKRLTIDPADLERRFYELSRRLHPDYFMTASADERQASMDRASLLNDAYRTLREPAARARYLLGMEGYKEAEKKAPPDLLEEVFELNLQIEELRAAKKMGDEDEAATAREELRQTLDGLRARLKGIDSKLLTLFENWDGAAASGSPDKARNALDSTSELLSHRSYIANLISEIEEEL
jgi:molecular chaperone HscB